MVKALFKGISIKIVTTWPVDELVELYKTGGWWFDHYNPDGITQLIKGSSAFAVAVDDRTGKAVGMGRVISDGVSDAYIQDVVVQKPYRGMGIGVNIIQTLLKQCLSKGMHWIGLIAEPGTKGFYTPLGFKTLPGEPMVYRPKPVTQKSQKTSKITKTNNTNNSTKIKENN